MTPVTANLGVAFTLTFPDPGCILGPMLMYKVKNP